LTGWIGNASGIMAFAVPLADAAQLAGSSRLTKKCWSNMNAGSRSRAVRAIITVVGKDRKGIIAGVCTDLSSNEINVLDIRQTIMDDFFTMIMLVDIADLTMPVDQLVERLERKGQELGVSIRFQREDIFNAMHRI
jgi:ACT domain-containing protein